MILTKWSNIGSGEEIRIIEIKIHILSGALDTKLSTVQKLLMQQLTLSLLSVNFEDR